jgi:hypothetical protein
MTIVASIMESRIANCIKAAFEKVLVGWLSILWSVPVKKWRFPKFPFSSLVSETDNLAEKVLPSACLQVTVLPIPIIFPFPL